MHDKTASDNKKLCWKDSNNSSEYSSQPPSRESTNSKDDEESGTNDPRSQCCWRGGVFFNAIKAMVTRQMFLLHAILVVWRAASVGGAKYWILLVFSVGQIAEAMVVLILRQGHEWKW